MQSFSGASAALTDGIDITIKNTFLEVIDSPMLALKRSVSDPSSAGRSEELRLLSDEESDRSDPLAGQAGENAKARHAAPAPDNEWAEAVPAVACVAVQPPVTNEASEEVAVLPACGEVRTTIMFRNLPYQMSSGRLEELLTLHGFARQYDLLYVPMDFRSSQSLGYGFLNLVSPEVALTFFSIFSGFSDWQWKSNKVCEVSWGEVQGLEANVNIYRNSPVMNPNVPQHFKPIIYEDGQPVEFPTPTKVLRPVRLRKVVVRGCKR